MFKKNIVIYYDSYMYDAQKFLDVLIIINKCNGFKLSIQ